MEVLKKLEEYLSFKISKQQKELNFLNAEQEKKQNRVGQGIHMLHVFSEQP